MSDEDFCAFVPGAAECQQNEIEPVKPTDGGKVEPDSGDKEIDDEMRQAMMSANVTYLLTAMSLTAHAALQQFRYRSSSTYYSAGDSLGTQNFWQLLNNVWNLFTIGYMGVASLTQLLSM